MDKSKKMAEDYQGLKAIVIPSGNPELHKKRVETAIRFKRKHGLDVPYIISGLGPGTNISLGHESSGKTDLVFHKDLYDFVMEETGPDGIFGVDILSIDSVGNILNTFPLEVSGKYGIVSGPSHLDRFKEILEEAQKEGKVSKDLELVYIPTEQTLREGMYGNLAMVKQRLGLKTGPLERLLQRIFGGS